MKWGCKGAAKEIGSLQIDFSLQNFFMWGRAMGLPVWLNHCLGLGLVLAERQSLELQLDWSCKGAVKGRSKLEKDFSCKNFIWNFMRVLPVNI